MYRIWLAWLVSAMSRSRLAHVAIGYDGVVLDPDVAGNRFWPEFSFTDKFPGDRLIGWFTVPITRPIDVDRVPFNIPKRALPAFIRALSRGRVRLGSQDCVCVVSDMLREGGIDVPSNIVMPQGLFDWLERCGFPYGRP